MADSLSGHLLVVFLPTALAYPDVTPLPGYILIVQGRVAQGQVAEGADGSRVGVARLALSNYPSS